MSRKRSTMRPRATVMREEQAITEPSPSHPNNPCATCAHNRGSMCRRYPPTWTSKGYYPQVGDGLGCGEWRAQDA